MELTTAFGRALKDIRRKRDLTQEDFSTVSSRTYLSTLERGHKALTIEKLEQLAGVLGVHPTTLLIAAYLQKEPSLDGRKILDRVAAELSELALDG